ncbi:hypothetical protein [Spirilliplanes yamanashiensis]|uniref:Uncharacterized protein n=1 Tax=Spirilliplanes yamanashiensis TaxID=42233 RepID=A0A8J4DL26_9ACTN|nr:hypothetical protein [Spirilliplanes yamanashiensis]MDP9818107.1 hypothetical protein [Spirilliplanes yamanashiensis]GIJ04918.1 hypothetical protein Sya03_42700 [Spirilliplanes yamanashiensis]
MAGVVFAAATTLVRACAGRLARLRVRAGAGPAAGADLACGALSLHVAVRAASPMLLPVPDAARIVAALGQVACWAAANGDADPWHAAVLGESAGSTVTLWAFAIESAADGVVLIGPDTAVRTRFALRAFLAKVSEGAWRVPRADRRSLREAIERDLALLC